MKTVIRSVRIQALPAGAALALLAFGCCGRPSAQLRPLTADSVILAFGDSLTEGTGADAAEAYPAVLERELGCRVINAGVAGERTDQGLERLPGAIAKYQPDLLILIHGGNDLLQRVEPATIKGNLARMIALARKEGSEVVLVGIPEPNLLLRTAALYDELARQFGIPYDRATLRDVLSTPSLKSDQIHPNAEGYTIIAENLAGLIRGAEKK
jgi:lysophospholipase L1-like esterase